MQTDEAQVRRPAQVPDSPAGLRVKTRGAVLSREVGRGIVGFCGRFSFSGKRFRHHWPRVGRSDAEHSPASLCRQIVAVFGRDAIDSVRGIAVSARRSKAFDCGTGTDEADKRHNTEEISREWAFC